MNFAIIPAKIGSTRLIKKNIKSFCGIPLVAWAIIQAKNTHFIDHVYVSTDSEEIANIATEYGAKPIFRTPALSGAYSGNISAITPIIEAIKKIYMCNEDIYLSKYINKISPFDNMLAFLPTSPLNLPDDFDKAFTLMMLSGYKSIIPLVKMRECNIKLNVDDALLKYTDHIFDKSGDKYLMEGGGWIISSVRNYLYENLKYFLKFDSAVDKEINIKNTGLYYERKYWQSLEVDTLEEFQLAELVMENFILKGKSYKDIYEAYGKKGEIEID